MRTHRIYRLLVIAAGPFWAVAAASEDPATRPAIENAVTFAERAEEAVASSVNDGHPLIEGYFQHCRVVTDTRCRLDSDRYVLARFDASKGDLKGALLTDRGTAGRSGTPKPEDTKRIIDGLIATMSPDWNQLSLDRYEYTFVKSTPVGALRTLVYDVKPRSAKKGFTGRIYLETETWNIVRYTGISSEADEMLSILRSAKSSFRLDGWRMNISKDRWVPAYVYIEEVAPLGDPPESVVRGQIRFWGYEKTSAGHETRGEVFLNNGVLADNRGGAWSGPATSQRIAEKQAEENTFARLKMALLISPDEDVRKMLNQVLNNLLITNQISGDPMECVVLTTGPLEAFLAGRKIVVSRELINVVPSESALAAVLAHMLAHSVLGHRKIDLRLYFAELLGIDDAELFETLRFRHSEAEEEEADKKAMEILSKSPYKGSLNDAALFMEIIQANSKSLTGMISPTFGEDLADLSHTVRKNVNTRTAELVDEMDIKQIAAKSLGSRLQMDPEDGRLAFFRQEQVLDPVLYERRPLGITSFAPYLDYFAQKVEAAKPVVPTKLPVRPRTGPPTQRPANTAPPIHRNTSVRPVPAALRQAE